MPVTVVTPPADGSGSPPTANVLMATTNGGAPHSPLGSFGNLKRVRTWRELIQ